jgi:hypothetical protein
MEEEGASLVEEVGASLVELWDLRRDKCLWRQPLVDSKCAAVPATTKDLSVAPSVRDSKVLCAAFSESAGGQLDSRGAGVFVLGTENGSVYTLAVGP